MTHQVLVNNGEEYSGKYVATRSFGDKSPVCSGKDPQAVLREAKQMGLEDPVIFYVLEKDMVHIY